MSRLKKLLTDDRRKVYKAIASIFRTKLASRRKCCRVAQASFVCIAR